MPEIGESPSLKLFVSMIIDDEETVGTDLQRANVGDMKKIKLHQSNESTVSMLTFFAALHQNLANFPSLKLFVSAIIDDAVTVGADLQSANIGDIKKLTVMSIP